MKKIIPLLLLAVLCLPWVSNISAEARLRYDPKTKYDGFVMDLPRQEEYEARQKNPEGLTVTKTNGEGLVVPLIAAVNGETEKWYPHMKVGAEEYILRFENNHLTGYKPANEMPAKLDGFEMDKVLVLDDFKMDRDGVLEMLNEYRNQAKKYAPENT